MQAVKILFFLLAIVVITALTFNVTYARYLTQSDCAVEYLAKTSERIYINNSMVYDRALLEISGWEASLNQTKATFTLSNFINVSEPREEDFVLNIKVFIPQENSEQGNNQTDVLPTEVRLKANENEYVSKAEELNEKTVFYKNNNQKGQFFSFYNSLTNQEEATFCLQGASRSELTITITVYNLQVDAENIYLCIEQVR